MRLQAAIEQSWGADTSADPDAWTPDNPAWGQCAVTALVVQDHLGGELRRGVVGDISHYWNVLPGGEEVDLTRGQFPEGAEVAGAYERTREYVLSYAPTAERYERLSARVADALAKPAALRVAPISLRAANKYVEGNHRHHDPSRGHKFSVRDGGVRGRSWTTPSRPRVDKHPTTDKVRRGAR